MTRNKPKTSSNPQGCATPKTRSNPVRTIAALVIMALGACCLAYPIMAQWRSARYERTVANDYLESSARMQAQEHDRLLAAAQTYNTRVRQGLTPQANISDESFLSDDDYMNQLSDGGVMAALSIPKISVQLPIYHGTGESSLSVGAGHLYGTSLPIGGPGTNSVIAGHRGLPDALIFTRLNELTQGDTFFIDVLGERHWYQVDATWVVDPDDVSHFGIEGDADYVTLLTCTPYGINTQRLLVRGKRIPAPDSVQQDHGFYPAGSYGIAVGMMCAVLGVVSIALWRRRADGRCPRHRAADGARTS